MNSFINSKIRFSYAGLFSSEREWIHPVRCEKTYEIIYVTKGEVHMREGEREFVLTRGQTAILTPGITHEGTAVTRDVGFYWVHFYLKSELPFEKRIFERFDNPHLFRELLHTNNLPQIPTYLVNAILIHILCELQSLEEQSKTSHSAAAEKIYEWIRINANGSLKAKDVANHFGFSADYVSRLMKQNYGTGAKELINRFTMSLARAMLSNTDMYVKEIANELRFVNDKTFISFFKYHEGCFPSDFRSKYSKIHMNNK